MLLKTFLFQLAVFNCFLPFAEVSNCLKYAALWSVSFP